MVSLIKTMLQVPTKFYIKISKKKAFFSKYFINEMTVSKSPNKFYIKILLRGIFQHLFY